LKCRNYIAKNYWELKTRNPNLSFIVRECKDADPYIIARYCISDGDGVNIIN